MGAAIGIAVLFGLIVGGVALSRQDEQATAGRQQELDRYTSDLEGVIRELEEPVRELGSLPTGVASEQQMDRLGDSVEKWRETLTEVQTMAFSLSPPSDVESVNRLFSNAIALYVGAVDTYELAAKATDVKLQSQIMNRAAAARGQANEAFLAAIAVLDDLREELDMTSSGLDAPGTAAPPSDEVSTIPPVTPAQPGGSDEEGGGARDQPKKD